MKKFKKYYKLIAIILIVIIVGTFGIFVYKNLFESNNIGRLDEIDKHQLTNKEINLVQNKFEKIENLNNIDIYTNYKIIKIFVEFQGNIDFDTIESVSNESINEFSEKNLEKLLTIKF